MIRCPKCKARIAYKDIGNLVAVLMLATVVVMAGALAVTKPLEVEDLIIFFAISLMAWVPIELITVWYLRSYKILEYRSGGKPPAVEDEA